MLKQFTDYFIAALELVEAQARSAGSGLVKTGINLTLAVSGAAVIGVAALVFGVALFLALRPLWGDAGAAAACGVLLVILGGVLLWIGSSRSKKK